ncbi:hypothetical protein AB0B31_11160 [Catellatospora citrea]|uniref:hypothetical protein n=1 Tax=Catellatospora citrea TaxID=53366 RepID=UPI0033F15F58
MDTSAQHDCVSAQTLVLEGVFAAPGFGQSWKCSSCGRGWTRIGADFYPVEDGVHILTIDDVR